MPDRPERNPDSAAEMQRLRGAQSGPPVLPASTASEGKLAITCGLLTTALLAIAALLLFTGVVSLPHDGHQADADVHKIVARAAADNGLASLVVNDAQSKVKEPDADQASASSTSPTSLSSGSSSKKPAAAESNAEKIGQLFSASDDRTEGSLVKILNENPQMMPARVRLVQIYTSRGLYDQARMLCEQGLQVSKNEGDRETFKGLMREIHAPAH